jgi:hypothetical protein
MLSPYIYGIRAATAADADALARLAQLDSQPPLTGPVLLGDLGGSPAAAISLADGRVVADPFRATAQVVVQLRIQAAAARALERTPSLRERMIAGLSPRVVAAARGAAA